MNYNPFKQDEPSKLNQPDQSRQQDDTSNNRNSNTCKPQIWCLIGNPGSGKSFLCHMTALRFGKKELSQFAYCLSIPCRCQEWHQLERDNSGKPIDGDHIVKWLCLSMPVGPKWTTDLAEHILESDGEGLLLIIDGLDEHIKTIPFQRTLLFLLLTRKTLSQSTILITSRPGAYTVISSSHTLPIDRFFQVLGFSPENRDLYFRKQLKGEKLDQLKSLLYLHEEINLLSLIPVNASLFAALVRGSDNVTAYTLTQLYTELITYLIRRQLFRMNLQELAKKKTLFEIHTSVLECLSRIGEVAFMGVSRRELTSTEDVLLKVGKVEKRCQCLGLAEEHIKKDHLGRITHIWSFSHLTIQEFVGAIWLNMSSWGDQCLSTRYIINSVESFTMFKMVIRFLCGLLSDKSNLVIGILYKYQPISPIPMENLPMRHQLKHSDSDKFNYSGWKEFTPKFLSLSEMLFESNSTKTIESFHYFREFLPQTLAFYFESSIPSPNEWKCFLKTLRLQQYIHLIFVSTEHVTQSQFSSLLTHLSSCTLSYLVVRMDYCSQILEYCDLLIGNQLSSETQICINLDLTFCDDEMDSKSADELFNSILRCFSSLKLGNSALIFQSNLQFYNQPSLIENISCTGNGDIFSMLFNCLTTLNTTTPLTGLDFVPSPEQVQQLLTILSELTDLQEIALGPVYYIAKANTFSLLPILSNRTNLKYLELQSKDSEAETDYKDNFKKLLENNKHSLRGLYLDNSKHTAFNFTDELLTQLQYCTNLVDIQFNLVDLQLDDVTLWGTLVSALKCLVWLELFNIPLGDSGMLSLSTGLLRHPNIRCLTIWWCELTYISCIIATYLIPTIPQLKRLRMGDYPSLSEPDPNHFDILWQTANLYSVEFEQF